MASTVRTRPSHYETLGLKPAATGEEIARAFAKETGPFRPRPLGGVAQVISAYETLRDPVKRRAYDASLGLKPEQGLDSSPTAALLRGWAGTIGPAPAVAGADARPEAPPERKPGSIYGAAPREPVSAAAPEPSPAPGSQAQPKPLRQVAAEPAVEPWIEDFLAMQRATADRSLEQSPIEWKRPGLAIGAVFVAVGLLGASVGWWAADDIEPQSERAATIGLPMAEARPATSVPSPAPPSVDEAVSQRPAPAAAQPARIKPAPAPQVQLDVPERQQAEQRPVAESASQPSEAEEPAIAQTGADAPSAPAVAAALPLPNRVVARTIERIGYACGQVASTTPVEGGAAGVFKVTCTSGQSYQARPVSGRYRFRRWGSD